MGGWLISKKVINQSPLLVSPEAEFKEFELQLKFETQLIYWLVPPKMYAMISHFKLKTFTKILFLFYSF